MTALLKQSRQIAENTTILSLESGSQIFLNKREAAPAISTLSVGASTVNTNTVTIGTKIYTFNTAVGFGNGLLPIGTAAISIERLIQAITLGPGSGTDYSGGTTLNTDIIITGFTASTMVVAAKIPGTAGNAIDTTDALATGSWTGLTLAGGTLLSAGKDNNFVVTLPTTPPTGTTFNFTTTDNGETFLTNRTFFTSWSIRSNTADGFNITGGPRIGNASNFRRDFFTTDPATGNDEVRIGGTLSKRGIVTRFTYAQGESINLTFENGTWFGNVVQGSSFYGAGDFE